MKNPRLKFLDADLSGLNICTDEVLQYYVIFNGAAELSKGIDEDGNTCYGVAVVQDNELRECKTYLNINEAKNYIYELKTPKKRR